MLTFESLRKDNVFKRKNRPDLFEQFLSDRSSWPDIAQQLEVTYQALFNFWKRHIEGKRLKESTVDNVKAGARIRERQAQIAEIGKNILFPITDDKFLHGDNPVQTLALIHKEILQLSVKKLMRIADDEKKTRDYVQLANSIRQYTNDWLNLFGTLPDKVVGDTLTLMQHKLEKIVEFIAERSPDLLPDLITYLEE